MFWNKRPKGMIDLDALAFEGQLLIFAAELDIILLCRRAFYEQQRGETSPEQSSYQQKRLPGGHLFYYLFISAL